MNTRELLQMEPLLFEMMVFGAYSRWVESVTTNLRDYQAVLANSSVNRWYLMELEKCENEFKSRVKNYNNLSKEDYRKCYNECTFKMFNVHPKALIEIVKIRKPSFGIIIEGLPIKTLTFNQN